MRGRPKNAQPEVTANKILHASTELFASHGFHGTSFRTIAKASGLSIGTIQHHFGTKDRLYDACIASMYKELGQVVDGLAEFLDDGPREFLERAVIHGFEFGLEHRTSVRLLTRAIQDGDGLPSTIRDEHAQPLLKTASETVSAALGIELSVATFGLQSSIFLIVRYALASERELKDFSFGSDLDPIEAVKKHLVQVVPMIIMGDSNFLK